MRAKAAENGIAASFMLVQSDGADMKAIANLLEKEIIKPFISQTFSLEEMKQAHIQQETGRKFELHIAVLDQEEKDVK